jgi:uncharacterized cofD-like protein
MKYDEKARPFSHLHLWLTPGMGVKRHVGLAVLGTVVLISGLVGMLLWLFHGERRLLSAPLEQGLQSNSWRQLGLWLSLLMLLCGLALVIIAIARLNRSLLSNWLPRPSEAAVVLHRRLSLSKGPKIVAIGGGTGLSTLLRGLRQYSSNLTAVVAVSDDGGSSGRLRRAFNMPAPGDLVDCLAALSDNELEVSRLLDYRFRRGGELNGHTFGNLLITTLTEVEGDFAQAIRLLNTLLSICGAVYPVTAEPTTLSAVKRSGEVVRGESRVREVAGAVERISIEPANPRVVPEVSLAIRAADLVVLGPGSLFTSTLPPLLVPEAKRALNETQAQLVYICNIMTEAGETDGFSAWEHIEVLARHLGRYPNRVAINTRAIDAERLERYRREGAEVAHFDPAPFAAAHLEPDLLPLLGDGPRAQHDPDILARWLLEISRVVNSPARTKPHLEPVP